MNAMGRGRRWAAPYRSTGPRARLRRMSPQDLATLATFLYGPTWRAAMADDTGIRGDNLGRLVTGRRGIPPPLAEFLLRRVADRWLLRAWSEQPPPAGLSPETAAELARRIVAARQAAATAQPGEPRGTATDDG